MADRIPSGVEKSSARPTMTAVPWIALPKPPPVKPGAGGNWVKTAGVNRGRPFCNSKKTIENNGMRVNSPERPDGKPDGSSGICHGISEFQQWLFPRGGERPLQPY